MGQSVKSRTILLSIMEGLNRDDAVGVEKDDHVRVKDSIIGIAWPFLSECSLKSGQYPPNWVARPPKPNRDAEEPTADYQREAPGGGPELKEIDSAKRRLGELEEEARCEDNWIKTGVPPVFGP